ncbi:MAG: hypothetical protein FJ087_19805 [Deltaproteobacteria bacterium]|nr:hypothetical protein [Deltaproteobacteria bacterium]
MRVGSRTAWTLAAVALCIANPASAESPPAPPPEVGWNPGPAPLPSAVLENTEVRRSIEVRRTDGGEASEAWLRSQRLDAALLVGDEVVPVRLNGPRFEIVWQVPAGPAEKPVRMRLKWKDASGEHERVGPSRTIRILPDVKIRLPAVTDVGAVHSGCPRESACVALDLSGSRGLITGTPLELSRLETTGWPDLVLTVRHGDSGVRDLARGAPILISYEVDRPIEVCAAPPRCGPVPSPAEEKVRVAPRVAGAEGTERAAETTVAASVTPNPWIECNLWWLLVIAAALLAGFISHGIVSPKSFPSSATLYVSNKERTLARDPGRPLYSVPHGRRGFYRSATCCFEGSGITVRRSSPHVLEIHAQGGTRLRLVPRGCLVERKERMAWKPVDLKAGDEWVEGGVVHRVGGAFFFRIDA